MGTTVIIFIILIIVFILGKFFLALNKDNKDLRNVPVEEKFEQIVHILNDAAFNGRGTITKKGNRDFTLYEEKQNQIITFSYSTGNLAITWRYKYFQKEILHEKIFSHVRNLSLFEQQKIADTMISEMDVVKQKHQQNVISIDNTATKAVVEHPTPKPAVNPTASYNQLMQEMANFDLQQRIIEAGDYLQKGAEKSKQKGHEDAAYSDFSAGISLLRSSYKEAMKNWDGVVFNEMIEAEIRLAELYYNRAQVNVVFKKYIEAFKDFELATDCRESFSRFEKIKAYDHFFSEAYREKGLLQILKLARSTNDARWADEGCKSLKRAKELGCNNADALIEFYCKNKT